MFDSILVGLIQAGFGGGKSSPPPPPEPPPPPPAPPPVEVAAEPAKTPLEIELEEEKKTKGKMFNVARRGRAATNVTKRGLLDEAVAKRTPGMLQYPGMKEKLGD